MEGIESFLGRPMWLAETKSVFEAVGALEIAAELGNIPLEVVGGDPQLDRLNALIAKRTGNDYKV